MARNKRACCCAWSSRLRWRCNPACATDAGLPVTYTLTITNLETVARSYALSLTGLAPGDYGPLTDIAVGSLATGAQVFTVTPNAANMVLPFTIEAVIAQTGVRGQAQAQVIVNGERRVVATLLPNPALAGRGNPAQLTLTVSNLGDLADVYQLTPVLPVGWQGVVLADGAPVAQSNGTAARVQLGGVQRGDHPICWCCAWRLPGVGGGAIRASTRHAGGGARRCASAGERGRCAVGSQCAHAYAVARGCVDGDGAEHRLGGRYICVDQQRRRRFGCGVLTGIGDAEPGPEPAGATDLWAVWVCAARILFVRRGGTVPVRAAGLGSRHGPHHHCTKSRFGDGARAGVGECEFAEPRHRRLHVGHHQYGQHR